MSPTPLPPQAIDGRQLGRRGIATRDKILETTSALLERNGIRELRVADIAREIDVSPATFYQYFPDTDAVLLELAASVGEHMLPILSHLDMQWSGDAGLSTARDFVGRFISYWDEHRSILRTRNLAAQEGDERFRAVRHRSLRPLLDGIANQIESNQARGMVSTSLSSVAAAAALVSMLERIAAFHSDLASDGVNDKEIVETVARMMFQVISGEATS